MTKFKKGDRVINKKTGVQDFVKAVPGDPVYDDYRFSLAQKGFLLSGDSWEFQDEWRLMSERPDEAERVRPSEITIDGIRYQLVALPGEVSQ